MQEKKKNESPKSRSILQQVLYMYFHQIGVEFRGQTFLSTLYLLSFSKGTLWLIHTWLIPNNNVTSAIVRQKTKLDEVRGEERPPRELKWEWTNVCGGASIARSKRDSENAHEDLACTVSRGDLAARDENAYYARGIGRVEFIEHVIVHRVGGGERYERTLVEVETSHLFVQSLRARMTKSGADRSIFWEWTKTFRDVA